MPCDLSLMPADHAGVLGDGEFVAGGVVASEEFVLAGLLAGREVMRLSPDGGRSFPKWRGNRRCEVVLGRVRPAQPVTIPVGDVDSGTGALVVLDLDVGKVPAGVVDRPGYVAGVADQVAVLLLRAGVLFVTDVSPSGGRHFYIPFSRSRPFRELRDLAEALAVRFHPVVDTAPMYAPDGQIRPPGAPHKMVGGRLTGYLRLHGMSLAQAVEAATVRNGAKEWNRLHQEVQAELAAAALGGRRRVATAGVLADVDTEGYFWASRLGGARPLSERLERLARTGDHVAAGYATRHQARLAVYGALYYGGHRFSEIQEAITDGPWQGLAVLWQGKRGWRGLSAAEQLWQKIAREASAGDPGSQSHTREPVPTPGAAEGGATAPGLDVVKVVDVPAARSPRNPRRRLTEYQLIREWHNAVRIAQQDPRIQAEWAGRTASLVALLRALGAAAQMCGSTTVAFGVRHLAEMTGLDKTTVARLLKYLCEGPVPLLDQVRVGRRKQADAYLLVIPEQYAAEAAWRSWRAGRIEALHATFLVLGTSAAAVYEALSTCPAGPTEIERATGLSAATVKRALKQLGEHGLAERPAPGAWQRGPADLDDVATELGATQELTARRAFHTAEREIWHELCDLWDAPPGSLAHTQAQIDTTREQALTDTDHHDDPQTPHDVEALLQETAHERHNTDNTPTDPLAWITPQHQAAMAALAEHALRDPRAAQLRTRRENTTNRPARQRTRTRPTPPPPPLIPLQATEIDQLIDNPVLQMLITELGAVILNDYHHPPPQ